MRTPSHYRQLVPIAGLLAAVILLTACGGSSDSSGTPAAAPASSSSSAPATAVRVAYLSFAVANTYDQPMQAAAQSVADDQGADVSVFDAGNDPQKQFTQLQDATSSGKFDAIIVQAINGTALIPEIEKAIAAGIKVVVMDQTVGPDLTTDQPQVDGLSANVIFVPSEIGTSLGNLTKQACANVDPCEVGYIYAIKVSALDTALRKAYDAAIAGSTAKVVAEGENFFTVDGGLKAAQDMLSRSPSIDVFISADQGVIGAQQAAKKAGAKPMLIGYGGSELGLASVKDGSWFGDVMQAPADTGRAAMEAAIAAVRDDKVTGAVNVLASLPDKGVVSKANVDQFTAQWKG